MNAKIHVGSFRNVTDNLVDEYVAMKPTASIATADIELARSSEMSVMSAGWNAMTQAQKSDFVFRRNGRIHLILQGRQFSRLLAVEVCASALIVGSNAGYIMFRGSEKGTGYSLHSPVSPSLPLPCVTVSHHISTGVYHSVELQGVVSWKTSILTVTAMKTLNIILYFVKHDAVKSLGIGGKVRQIFRRGCRWSLVRSFIPPYPPLYLGGGGAWWLLGRWLNETGVGREGKSLCRVSRLVVQPVFDT
jgi:hypothetical protein